MSDDSRHQQIPRPFLIGFAMVITLSILAAGVGRLWGRSDSEHTAPAVASRDLVFRDEPNGAVAIFDARDPSTPISVAAPATNGFLRGTLRGLARQRLRQDADRAADSAVPFRLTGWADGRLTLEDPSTHRAVEVEAFGISNEEVFARLLTAQPMHDLPLTEKSGS